MSGIIWLMVPSMVGAAPDEVNFQGRLSDSGGAPVTDPAVTMIFRVFDDELAGTKLWEETQSVDVQEGIYNVILGSSTLFDADLFSSDNRWLEVVVNGERLDPRQKMTSVPFALQADQADYAISADTVSAPLGLSGSSPNAIISGTNSADGYGVYGESSSGTGIYGRAKSQNQIAVYGDNEVTGSFGYIGGGQHGVYGETIYDFAMYGQHTNTGNYGYIGNEYDGVYGQSSVYGGGGIYGVHTGDGWGVYGQSSGGYAGYFQGDVHVTGTISATSKPFIQPHARDPRLEIVYIATEGPEAVVFHRGTGRLERGKAVIKLPEHFRLVAAAEGVQVQVTPLEDCNGIFVASKSQDRFEVKELMDGKGNAGFDYYVTAVRAGFEGHKPVVANTHFKPRDGETARDFEARYSKDDMSIKAVRSMLTSSGILTKEGKLNMTKVKELGWTVSEEGTYRRRVARKEPGDRSKDQ
jgi:hypothetical protein